MNPTQLGVTITGEVATITVTVPALWLLAVLVMAGILATMTQVRDWLSDLMDRVRKDDEAIARAKTWE
jgi:hypothetical protein